MDDLDQRQIMIAMAQDIQALSHDLEQARNMLWALVHSLPGHEITVPWSEWTTANPDAQREMVVSDDPDKLTIKFEARCVEPSSNQPKDK